MHTAEGSFKSIPLLNRGGWVYHSQGYNLNAHPKKADRKGGEGRKTAGFSICKTHRFDGGGGGGGRVFPMNIHGARSICAVILILIKMDLRIF